MTACAAYLKNVSFRYANGDAGALNGVDISIAQGECLLLCGTSGCGKTTVTRLLNGLVPHYFEGELHGDVTVLGRDIRCTPIEELAGSVGSVFQNPRSQFFCVDTTSEIAFGCENLGLPEQQIRQRIQAAARDMNIQKLLDRSIFNLSGGEKQKIACASTAAMLPQLIVLDEPTSNLDLDAIDELRQILVMWKKQGKTIVIAEHRLGWLEGVCDRVLFMQQGSVKEEFPAHDFFSLTTEQLNSRGLRAVRTKTNYLETQTGITALAEPETHGTIRLENYHYSYSGQDAVHIDALEIPKGGVIAVVGHNGAGKSTFIRCLCGLQKGFKGRAVIDGKRLKPKQMLALSYMVMQDVNHQLFTDTVLDEVMLSAGGDDKQKAMQLLEKLNIAQFADRHPMSLSGGQKQRTAIASALTAGKKLLVFDEPTSGLDFAGMQCSAELIRSLGTDVTVLIVTHDMELIQRCCTHVLHIENGSI
ncbi:MAG: ABC transporter ATP-binding protein [Ruminococcus sp.]|nr:ABC transporter ATP-binding protein [Ruminococcus sp.]